MLDVFAGTADRNGDSVAHSYRIEGGPWRIDLVDLTNDAATLLLELSGDDPRPVLVDSFVVYRHVGELWSLDIGTGIRAAVKVIRLQPEPRFTRSRL